MRTLAGSGEYPAGVGGAWCAAYYDSNHDSDFDESQRVSELDEAVGAIDRAAERLSSLSGAEAVLELKQVTQLVSKIEAYKSDLVRLVRKSEVWRAENPNGTPTSFLKYELNLDQRQAHAELRVAEALDELPELAAALANGEIGRAAVDLVVSYGLRNQQRREALPHFLASFIQLAKVGRLSELRGALSVWADQVDPVSTAMDESAAIGRRYLHISELGEGLKIDGYFDKVAGQKILAAFNAAYTAYYKQINSNGDSPEVDPSIIDSTVLTAKQRADAFIKLIIEPACDGRVLPSSGGITPNLVVTVSADRLVSPNVDKQEILDAIAARDLAGLDLKSATIETTNGSRRTILSHQSVLQVTCDANVQRIILGPDSVPLDVGRSTRVIPPHMRRALIIRDGGCKFPYCERPVAWCEAHHIQHWSQGGQTNLNNLVMLCSRHHHEVHAVGHKILIDSDGKPEVVVKHPYFQRE